MGTLLTENPFRGHLSVRKGGGGRWYRVRSKKVLRLLFYWITSLPHQEHHFNAPIEFKGAPIHNHRVTEFGTFSGGSAGAAQAVAKGVVSF